MAYDLLKEKDDWPTDLINQYKGVCRTAPTTPDRFNKQKKNKTIFSNKIAWKSNLLVSNMGF